MTTNADLFARAQAAIPGGVNSPVRAFRSVGGTPRFFVRGEGPYVFDADGVHVGDDDGSIANARARVGPDRIIGVSCYDDFDRARAAVDAGADYVAFGSFFTSPVKPDARRASVDLLGRARALRVPVVAIGGITARNAATLIVAGADALAVISDVFAHDDPAHVARAAAAIARQFTTHPRESA